MLRLAILTLTLPIAWAQFKASVPLVVAPTTVTDQKGRFIDGLTEKDLTVYDNGVPQSIQVSGVYNPISLVAVIQANVGAAAILDKLGGSGVLLSELIAAEGGETAIVLFGAEAKVLQPFSRDSSKSSKALHGLKPRGNGCALLDGIHEGLHLLASRDLNRRRVLLVIAERRDRSSKLKLQELLQEDPLQNTTIYWITFSTFMAPYTDRPKTVWDRMTDDEKAEWKRRHGKFSEDDTLLPPDLPPGNLLSIFTELAHKSATDVADLLTRTTGGRTFTTLNRASIEHAIQSAGEEIHQQYMITFQPNISEPGQIHTLSAEVKSRPEWKVRTRGGYWRVD
jgi:VWFA-related protein